jgi:hypothetical protein
MTAGSSRYITPVFPLLLFHNSKIVLEPHSGCRLKHLKMIRGGQHETESAPV